jgi:molybdenum cofactor cytidylyltransferase
VKTGGPKTTADLDAVVLAAGAGSRFGGGKLLAPWRDGLLLDGALSAAFAAPVRSVLVVWGADRRVCDAARGFARGIGDEDRLKLVHAPCFADGLSASLKAGVAALPGDCAGAFIFLGDMPRIPPAVPAALAGALKPGVQAAAPTFSGQRGHPVLFSRGLLPSLLTLSGDQGAGPLLKGLGEALALVPAPDDGVLYDVDRREDLGG